MSDKNTPSAATSSRWNDLSTRLASALVLVALGATAIFQGGIWFSLFTTFAAGMIVWEVGQIIKPAAHLESAAMAVLTTAIVTALPPDLTLGWEKLAFLIPALAGLYLFRPHGVIFAFFALAAALAGWALLTFRVAPGLYFVLWIVTVVIATDVMGYFAGRTIGGPKFWPRVSPKKTWAGVVAGWIGAGLVGAAFIWPLRLGWELIPISMAMSLFSQLGDIAESALKRKFGVKDSSNLIPGHGGVFDRFDALIGASFFIMLIWLTTGWPG